MFCCSMNIFFSFSCRCGSGLSGEVLTSEGHYWVGLDISQAMLGKIYQNKIHIGILESSNLITMIVNFNNWHLLP